MRIAMVGARFAGLDGVSLEAAKIAEALERAGHEIVWYAGEIDQKFSPAVVFSPASFGDETNVAIQNLAFDGGDPDQVRTGIAVAAAAIRSSFEDFLDSFRVDAAIIQNAWAIPMHLPLALAVSEVVQDRGIPTVGHHHDFAWERRRFDVCVVPEVLERFFPPSDGHIAHLAINSIAAGELRARRGLSAAVLPNVMDFERGARSHDGGRGFRRLAGVEATDIVLLQPTRVIPRKAIESTIELAAGLDGDPKVIVTHPDDLDPEYWATLTALATSRGVDLRLVDAGRDRHALASAYAAADLVCFPSTYEGYGNALVETVFYNRPLMVNRYAVYSADIVSLGFDFLELDGAVTEETIAAAAEIVRGGDDVDAKADHNFDVGRGNLSYARAVGEIEACLAQVM